MNQPLAGKIAFITGGARGIGRACALKLAGAGCDVAIAYHNSHEEAEAFCESIRKFGRKAQAIQANVSEPESDIERSSHRFTDYDGRSVACGTSITPFLGAFFLPICRRFRLWPLSNASKVPQKFGMTHM